MSINYKKNTEFQKREKLDGKSENTIRIICKNCTEAKNVYYNNKKCIICIFKNLYRNKNKKLDYIFVESSDKIINSEKFLLILNYFNKLKKIKSIFKKIENLKKKKCLFESFKCKILPNYYSFFRIEKERYYDPLFIFNFVQEKQKTLKKRELIDLNCQKCYVIIKSSFEIVLKILNNLKIIQKINNFQKNHFLHKYSNFYEFWLSDNFQLPEKKSSTSVINNEELIDILNIGKHKLFQISILNIFDETENKYLIQIYNSNSNKDYFEKIIEVILKNLEFSSPNQIIPLETLIKIYKQNVLNFLESRFNLSQKEKRKIAFLTALKKLNLLKLFPLLIDDNIEEIFLDSPDDEIYINHQKYGRCRTKIRLSLKEIERIKTLLRLYSGQRLDYMNPSIKFVIKNKYFNCRFALDVRPVQAENFALDIRKLNKNILTIQDLLKNKTLNPLMAAFLYFNILRRANITVTGETDTGKTTLINAFDLLTPKDFRKIYIENVIESLNQSTFNKHQLKYQSDSLTDSLDGKYSKSNYIKTLLHRTPDIIYLGEILTKEEAEAMFHCLAAGLRGFQTIHSNNIDSLINRFLYHFKINLSCLEDMDLIILVKKDFYKRRVVSISEISNNLHETEKYHHSLFQYNPGSKMWDNLLSLYKTNTIQKLRKFEDLSESKFEGVMELYFDIFETLMKIKKVSNTKLVNLFHKISYYSMNSIKLLEDFWNNWKKNRSLNY